MVIRNKDTGRCSIINPCYDPAYWNKPRDERVILKNAMANKTLRIEKDKDGWISVWYKNRFISDWFAYDPRKLSRDVLDTIAHMLRAEYDLEPGKPVNKYMLDKIDKFLEEHPEI